jgi:hypothetical protein
MKSLVLFDPGGGETQLHSSFLGLAISLRMRTPEPGYWQIDTHELSLRALLWHDLEGLWQWLVLTTNITLDTVCFLRQTYKTFRQWAQLPPAGITNTIILVILNPLEPAKRPDWYDTFVKLQLGSHPVTVVQYTFTHKQYIEWHKTNDIQNNAKIFVRVRAVLRLCELYPDICLTTEEKARKNLSQCGRRVPIGTMKIRYMINWRNPAEQISQYLYLKTEEETLGVSNIPQKMDSVQYTTCITQVYWYDMISINICQFI